jgi:hypothetical protein
VVLFAQRTQNPLVALNANKDRLCGRDVFQDYFARPRLATGEVEWKSFHRTHSHSISPDIQTNALTPGFLISFVVDCYQSWSALLVVAQKNPNLKHFSPTQPPEVLWLNCNLPLFAPTLDSNPPPAIFSFFVK